MQIMKKVLPLFLLVLGLFSWACQPKDMDDPMAYEPEQVVKTNPTRLYMHYMPWFHSKEISGYWGIHWRMANKNPENILPNGKREIASHYYPLIGPYDSADPDVIDYHLLLMKYAGVDGVLIDWYGSHDVLDYGSNLVNANALIEGIKRTGLDFAIVYEEFTADEVGRRTELTDMEAARQDMQYMQENYYSSNRYIKIDDKPLLLTFGPRYFKTKAQWTQILGALNAPPTFLPLWGHTHRVGTENADGEFSWVDFKPTYQDLINFYQSTAQNVKIGSAYPGFHDFYEQGGWGDSYGFIDHQDGAVLQATFDLADSFNQPYLQLVTWNDFGEGTIFEPTDEFQYKYLEMLQDFAGVQYDIGVLELIHTYYLKRKEYAENDDARQTLDEVFGALIQLEVSKAEQLLSSL
jgi:hypothetical protein